MTVPGHKARRGDYAMLFTTAMMTLSTGSKLAKLTCRDMVLPDKPRAGGKYAVGTAGPENGKEAAIQKLAADLRRQMPNNRTLLWTIGSLIALHITIMASVLPYAYVGDVGANCGARMILSRFGWETILVCLLSLVPIFGASHASRHESETLEITDIPGDRRFIFLALMTWILLVLILVIAVRDLVFLTDPPKLSPRSPECVGVAAR